MSYNHKKKLKAQWQKIEINHLKKTHCWQNGETKLKKHSFICKTVSSMHVIAEFIRPLKLKPQNNRNSSNNNKRYMERKKWVLRVGTKRLCSFLSKVFKMFANSPKNHILSCPFRCEVNTGNNSECCCFLDGK